jgi:hypothetical protein
MPIMICRGQGVQDRHDLVGKLAVTRHQHHANRSAEPRRCRGRIAGAEFGRGIDEEVRGSAQRSVLEFDRCGDRHQGGSHCRLLVSSILPSRCDETGR